MASKYYFNYLFYSYFPRKQSRPSWKEERKLNTETFGTSDPRRGFRGRGGFRGNRGYNNYNGYRGRGRGGGGNGGGYKGKHRRFLNTSQCESLWL